MKVINVRNVHNALPEALYQLRDDHVREESRNGPVMVFPTPVTTIYQRPQERVIFWEERDANPFFHLFESIWLLAGRNDVAYIAAFNKNIANYSDDGLTFNASYGHRWRVHFGYDQLIEAVNQLKADKTSRRVVIQMWDGAFDLKQATKDKPCNTNAYVWIRDGKLHITVCNRSNDLIWGAYGANAVQFSFLQEFLASALGLAIGTYWQVSNNLHAYVNTWEPLQNLADKAKSGHWPTMRVDPYDSSESCKPFPIMSATGDNPHLTWLHDAAMFCEAPEAVGYRHRFFRSVARPMLKAFSEYTNDKSLKGVQEALDLLDSDCVPCDWHEAGAQWLVRRAVAIQKKQQGV